MKRRRLLVASGTVLTLTIAGCSGDTDGDGRERSIGGDRESGSDGGEGESEQDVELLDHELYNEGQFDVGVSGTLENVSGEELSYVAVEIFFLDSDGTQIDEGLDNTTDLAPERRWEFDAMYLGDEADRIDTYEIETDVSNF
ncbi:MAG: FxLYD domain-containing protein [Euryarchaeota archaeon]|nr:FxLYD domain-containing protein [Euryarchaeota archaeon]